MGFRPKRRLALPIRPGSFLQIQDFNCARPVVASVATNRLMPTGLPHSKIFAFHKKTFKTIGHQIP